MRHEFTRATKREAFKRCEGRCEAIREEDGLRCNAFLYVGKFHYDHIIADALGGDNSLENCAVLCLAHHSQKTAKHDIPTIAKSDRQRDKYSGAYVKKSPPMMGSRASAWKHKMNGKAERR